MKKVHCFVEVFFFHYPDRGRAKYVNKFRLIKYLNEVGSFDLQQGKKEQALILSGELVDYSFEVEIHITLEILSDAYSQVFKLNKKFYTALKNKN